MDPVPSAKANDVLLKVQEAIKHGLDNKALSDVVKSVSAFLLWFHRSIGWVVGSAAAVSD